MQVQGQTLTTPNPVQISVHVSFARDLTLQSSSGWQSLQGLGDTKEPLFQLLGPTQDQCLFIKTQMSQVPSEIITPVCVLEILQRIKMLLKNLLTPVQR